MTNFVVITGQNGYERINLDTVRHITEEMNGQITLHFDLTHRLTVDRENARHVMNEINKPQNTAA
jgi:hypothetical protein